jgi:hypothetical protein
MQYGLVAVCSAGAALSYKSPEPQLADRDSEDVFDARLTTKLTCDLGKSEVILHGACF